MSFLFRTSFLIFCRLCSCFCATASKFSRNDCTSSVSNLNKHETWHRPSSTPVFVYRFESAAENFDSNWGDNIIINLFSQVWLVKSYENIKCGMEKRKREKDSFFCYSSFEVWEYVFCMITAEKIEKERERKITVKKFLGKKIEYFQAVNYSSLKRI